MLVQLAIAKIANVLFQNNGMSILKVFVNLHFILFEDNVQMKEKYTYSLIPYLIFLVSTLTEFVIFNLKVTIYFKN